MKNTLDPNSVKYRVAQRKEMEDVTSIIHILYPNTSHMHPQNTRPGKHYHVHCTVERDTHLVPEYIANVPPEYTAQQTLTCTLYDIHILNPNPSQMYPQNTRPRKHYHVQLYGIHILYPNPSQMYPPNTRPRKHYHVQLYGIHILCPNPSHMYPQNTRPRKHYQVQLYGIHILCPNPSHMYPQNTRTRKH